MPPPERISIRFSQPAGYAAGLVATEDGGWAPIWWSFGGDRPEGTPLHRALPSAETTRTQPMPTPDGRVLLLRTGVGRHELALLDPAQTDPPGQTLTVAAQGLRLCPGPRPDDLALALEHGPGGRTTVWRVRAEPLRLVRVTDLPGRVSTLHPLDTEGRRFGTDLRSDDHSGPVAVDLDERSWAPLPFPCSARTHRLLLSAPQAPGGGMLVVASDADGPLRMGISTIDDPRRVRFPAHLNALDAAALPLAADPHGSRIALRVRRGIGAQLMYYDVADDRLAPAPLPPGSLYPTAAWATDGLRVAYSRPDLPTHIRKVLPYEPGGPATPARGGAAATRTEWFDAPGGGFQAVCQGDWKGPGPVVIALHGGPEAAWELGYDAVLHRLAAAGLAVVAPNQRGSTGYGTAHAAAIHGAWGGPDLADIRHLVRTIRRRRGPQAPAPALYGTSYGAFLALLALGTEPDAWSRCAVVAPFLSVARLYAEAGPPTRALIDRHAAHPGTADAPDVWHLAERFRAPLLIVHGEQDGNVPVGQSRALRRRLLALGRREHTDFLYTEVPDAGHHPLQTTGGAALPARLTAFLAGAATAPQRPTDLPAAPRSGKPPAPAAADHRLCVRR